MRRSRAWLALACLLPACTAPEAARSRPLLELAVAAERREAAVAALPGTTPEAEVSTRLRGRYVNSSDGEVLELFRGESGLAGRMVGVADAPVRWDNGDLVLWLPRNDGFESELLEQAAEGLTFRGATWHRDPGPRRPPAAPAVERVLGLYNLAQDHSAPLRFYLLQWEGRLWLQIGDLHLVAAEADADGLELAQNAMRLARLRWAESGSPDAGLQLDGVTLDRVSGARQGPTFKIDPVRSVEELRAAALEATPPVEGEGLRTPDLVELTTLEPEIRLDIRYATTNNFMGAVFYEQPRAFMQRPAAEALVRVQRNLAEQGFGLLVYDAYRPWLATKMFWDATPADKKQFVADPARGSRHNRGCAVDLTLVDLATGEPVAMTGGYDEFTERSYPFYPGGTDRQRWHRELLRRSMEAEGFAVYEYEWWHFDFHEWAEYPVLDRSFDSLTDSPESTE